MSAHSMSRDTPDPASGPLRVGDVEVPGRAFLAPMSGVTDLPYRRLAARLGAPLVVSEMVASDEMVSGSSEANLRAMGEGLPLHVVQLAGTEPKPMARAAAMAEGSGADIIDINMGCPSKRVVNAYSGSALMRDLDHAMRLIEATLRATTRPVTLKMRLGWDDTSINAPELARRAEAAGIALVTVHARTRCQFYKGAADWKRLRAVADAVSIPVIGNGDLVDPRGAPELARTLGLAGVMIGRGAYGAPWLVGQAAAVFRGEAPGRVPVGDALMTLVHEHYDAMLAHYGVHHGVRMARKHLGWYLDRLPHVPADARRAILTEEEPRSVFAWLANLFGDVQAAA